MSGVTVLGVAVLGVLESAVLGVLESAVLGVLESAVFERLFETFGPFLIPATIFLIGAVGYLILYAIERSRNEDWLGGDG